MHGFLRSIGFSKIKNRQLLEPVYRQILGSPTRKTLTNLSADTQLIQLDKDFSEYFGISLIGECAIDGSISIEHYFPYVRSNVITYQDQIYIERHGDKEAFAGVSNSYNLGITLIFFLQNIGEYEKSRWMNRYNQFVDHVYLGALSKSGKIILDIDQLSHDKASTSHKNDNRKKLVEAAKNGDKTALESLTLDDMDTYSIIEKRIQNEDVLSIVESCFMPYGIETEHYSIIGNILDVVHTTNTFTEESVFVLTVETNDILMKVAINEKDLLGYPEVGRRFKGEIWLQGRITV
jgi:hypothetical protein